MDRAATFAELTDQYLADLYAAEPVMATAKGVHAWDELLPDPSLFASQESLRRCRAYLHALDKVSLAVMTPDERVDYRIARADTQGRILDLERLHARERRPAGHVDTVALGVHLLLSREFAPADQRADASYQRLCAIPEYLLHAREIVGRPSRSNVEIAVESVSRAAAYFAADVPAFAESHLSGRVAVYVSEAARAAAEAVEDYERFLREVWLPQAQDDAPLGADLFEYKLRVVHLLPESSEELAEAARDEIEFSWVIPAESRPPAAVDISVREEIERARRFVEKKELVTVPSDGRLSIQAPTVLFPTTTYIPAGPFDDVQTGTLHVADETDSLSFAAAAWAYPGRHLQSLCGNRHPSRYRRHFAESELFTEGWKLYSAELMAEQRFARDESIGRRLRMTAAAGALADVEVHCGRMTLDEAACLFAERAGLLRDEAHAAARRIAANPCQALAAFAGFRQISALRERAARKWGERRDLRAFHDGVLACGAIPPRLIEELLFAID